MTTSKPHIVVVGAGAFGVWSAWHLLQRGARVTLLDAWGPGNSRSSSGGESRVIRAVYGPDRLYVEMVGRSWTLWEEIDSTTDERLYTETGALWMHRSDDAYVRSSLSVLEELGFPVDAIELADARKRYPMIDFDGIESVWLERRAGVLSARQACITVRDGFLAGGGEYQTAHATPGEIANGAMKNVALDDGSRIEADAFVFACGPWLGRVFPDVIGHHIRPTRQEVHYFGTPRGSDDYRPGRLPVWIDFGERILYGLPDVHNRGFKIADDTRGAKIDPSTEERTPSAEGLERARALLRERFPAIADAPLIESRVCQYENSPDGHLILDRHPGAENIWIAGGGSGHGFKLSPAVGGMISSAVLDKAQLPALFGIDRLGKDDKTRTQFGK